MKKSVILPLALVAYLGAMSYVGYSGYASGEFSAMRYYGVIAVSFAVIVLLYFSLKRKEKLRKEREDDMKNNRNRHFNH